MTSKWEWKYPTASVAEYSRVIDEQTAATIEQALARSENYRWSGNRLVRRKA